MTMVETDFIQEILSWFDANGRQFYWRTKSLSPFQILVTEMLLKRTRAETVDKYGFELVKQLESPQVLIDMGDDELISNIKPFGIYNRRSKNMKSVANSLIVQSDGEVPNDREELLKINGVGDYIADSVLCFAYEKPVVVIDTNTIAVAEHYFGIPRPSDPRQDTEIRQKLNPLVPTDKPKIFNWGIIDVGAALRENEQDCPDCPLNLDGHIER